MRDDFDCRDCIKVDEFSKILSTVAPELVAVLEDRYNILTMISYLQPIGRRSLSSKLNITERVIRKEANTLKEQGLVDFSLEGMTVTPEGETVLETLKLMFHDLKGLKTIEQKLAEVLNIQKVIIGAAGTQDEDYEMKELGRSAAQYLAECMTDGNVVGVTGGTSVFSVIEAFKSEKKTYENAIVVPARGGLGKKTEFQANTLVEKLADKLGSQYRMLYTPDNLSQTAIESLRNEPEIREITEILGKMNMLVFGIGEALTMAKRRSLEAEEIETIIQKGAVSEAFGYYFNAKGEIVHEISTIGIDLEIFKSLDELIAVAAGEGKADAIISICRLNPNLVLVTDEKVARKILHT